MSSCVDVIPPLGGDGMRLRSGFKHWIEDIKLVLDGKLDPRGAWSGHQLVMNPVEFIVFDGPKLAKMGAKLEIDDARDPKNVIAHWNDGDKRLDFNEIEYPNDPLQLAAMGCEFVPAKRGAGGILLREEFWKFDGKRIKLGEKKWAPAIKAIRRSHNLRTTMGRDQIQRGLMFGNITANASSYTGVTGAATSTSATSLTNTGAAFPTTGGPNTGLQGQVVVCMAAGVTGVFGIILSNTATVLTIDQWWNPASATAAAGSTPGSTSEYLVLPWNSFTNWIGLSTNSSAAAAGDVTRTADGLYGDGTTSGAATEQSGSGLARTYVQPTFPGAGQIQLQNTWTYTGSSLVTLAKAILFNTKAAAGTLLFLETLLSANASVNANGDTCQLTWTINL